MPFIRLLQILHVPHHSVVSSALCVNERWKSSYAADVIFFFFMHMLLPQITTFDFHIFAKKIIKGFNFHDLLGDQGDDTWALAGDRTWAGGWGLVATEADENEEDKEDEDEEEDADNYVEL